MAQAVDQSGEPARSALRAAAKQRGKELAFAGGAGTAPQHEGAAGDVIDALRALGYEPRVDAEGEVRLGNCPYAALVPEHRETTCGMNLAVIEGLLEGLAADGVSARLDPQPGCCCVALALGASEPPPAT
jgi:predicted ArsR family transcriptional regulator